MHIFQFAFQLCPFHAVFHLAAFAGLCPCFQLLIFFQKVFDRDLVFFQLPGEVLHLRKPFFQHGEGFFLFLSGVQRVYAVKGGFNGSGLFGEGNRLFEKSENYRDNQKRLTALEKEETDRKRQIQSCEKRVGELENLLTELSADKAAMEKERESLSKSDAVGLKQKELELAERISGNEKTLEEKDAQLAAKQDQYIEIENRKKAAHKKVL